MERRIQKYVEPEDAERYVIVSTNSMGYMQVIGTNDRSYFRSLGSATRAAINLGRTYQDGRNFTVTPIFGSGKDW